MRTALSTSDAVWQHPLAQHIEAALVQFPIEQKFVVACSGGRDSLVLADLMAHYCADRVRLLHVNHQLQVDAADWAQQLCAWAAGRGVACTVCAVEVAAGNLEAQARQARYQAFAMHVESDEVLLLAHHQQDQAETVLMRVFAGSGVQGLSAMRVHDQRAGLRLWRPLLGCARVMIDAFARLRGLAFIDDPANQINQYERVYLRQQVWPVLQARWPSVEQTIGRVAGFMQDAAEILADVVAEDLARCQSSEGLSVTALTCLSAPRQRQLIAHWMRGEQVYAPPLHRVLAVLQLANTKSTGQVAWQAWDFRYYQGHLYRLLSQCSATNLAHTQQVLQLNQLLMLPSGRWQVQSAVDGLPLGLLGCRLELVSRAGGERLHLEGRVGQWPLKKFLQQLGIPVWQRDQVQLLHRVTDELPEILAVLTPKGCFICASMLQQQQPSWRLQRV